MGLRDGQGLGGLLLFMVLYVVVMLASGVTAIYLFYIGWWAPAVLPGGLCLYMIYLVARAWRW
jgi:hypothetical protein